MRGVEHGRVFQAAKRIKFFISDILDECCIFVFSCKPELKLNICRTQIENNFEQYQRETQLTGKIGFCSTYPSHFTEQKRVTAILDFTSDFLRYHFIEDYSSSPYIVFLHRVPSLHIFTSYILNSTTVGFFNQLYLRHRT